jgi:hypothetical protein
MMMRRPGLRWLAGLLMEVEAGDINIIIPPLPRVALPPSRAKVLLV